MYFVYTSWYIVIVALIALSIACLVAFIQMDKKDRALIKQFVEENSTPAPAAETPAPVTVASPAQPAQEEPTASPVSTDSAQPAPAQPDSTSTDAKE